MTSQVTFYLSRIIGKKFYSDKNKVIGIVKDLLIDMSRERPQVVAIKTKINNQEVFIDFSEFEIFKLKSLLFVRCNKIIQRSSDDYPDSILLAENVLDKQIVDINGRKLVRVNDIRLVMIPSGAYLIAVDVGLEGLLRRIGISRPLKIGLGLFHITLPSKFIIWDDVGHVGQMHRGLQLNTSYKKLHTLHPSDLADIIEDLDNQSRANLFKSLDEEKAADVLEELETHAQVHIIESLSTEKAADVLEKMPADEVADILEELEHDKAEEILNEMEKESSAEVRELLEYPDNRVGSIMTTDFFTFREIMTVEETIAELRQLKPEQDMIYSLFITDDNNHLLATVSLRDIIVSESNTTLKDIMQSDPIKIEDYDKIDSLAELISKYDLLAIPVVNKEDQMLGMVVIDDIVEDLLNRRKTK